MSESCKRGNLEIVKFLIEQGVDLSKNKLEISDLRFAFTADAVRGYNIDVFNFVVDNGASIFDETH